MKYPRALEYILRVAELRHDSIKFRYAVDETDAGVGVESLDKAK